MEVAKTMKALVVDGPRKHRVAEVPRPEPQEREVLIRVDSCGFCGTDFHIYEGRYFANYPLIIGHEISGKVVEVGKRVTRFKVGQTVAVDPNISCGYCRFCAKGKVHLCENLDNVGVRRDGGFAEYVTVWENNVYPISGKVDLEAASLIEPLSCCVHGADIAGVATADKVVLIGVGPVGLIMLQLIRITGAAEVLVIDPIDEKREIAERLGADYTLDPRGIDIQKSVSEKLGKPPDVVVECVGSQATMDLAWQMADLGGRVVWFGVSDPDVEVAVKPYEVFRKEISIAGSYINPFTFARAIELLEANQVDLKSLITHRFSLDEFPQALETYKTDQRKIKMIMKP